MKNKLFYLAGAVLLLCSTGTFTSCINGVDDEYLELINSGNGGGDTGEEEGPELLDLNGDYQQGGDLELTLIYNGEELTGKKVNVATDERNETATFTLAGAEQDLSELVGGLLNWKFETFSPVPGMREVVIPDVELAGSKASNYWFEGALIDPTFTLNCKGTIKDGKMEIIIDHQLVNQTLAGTWNLAPEAIIGGNNTSLYSPLWLDWDSRITVTLGRVSFVNVRGEMNGIFSILTGAISGLVMNQIIGTNIRTQNLIRNMLQGITALPTGSIYATYSYSGDVQNPAWSSEMSHNIIRYYFDPESPDNRLYLEVNSNVIAGLIGGLVNPATDETPAPEGTRAPDPGVTQELGRQLIALLTPLLQEGIPCDYVLEGENLNVNIDGVVLRDVLAKVFELTNDELAAPIVEDFLKANLGDFSSNLMNLVRLAPYTLKYQNATTYDPTTNVPLDPEGECAYVKLGLKFVKAL